jgi:hypothetical protein
MHPKRSNLLAFEWMKISFVLRIEQSDVPSCFMRVV